MFIECKICTFGYDPIEPEGGEIVIVGIAVGHWGGLTEHCKTGLQVLLHSHHYNSLVFFKKYFLLNIDRNYHGWSKSARVVGGKDGVEGGYEGGLVEAVEGSSSLPLGGHPVHISKAGVEAASKHPLRVVILLVPAHPGGQAHVDHVEDLVAASAPGGLDGPAPGLGDEGGYFQVVGEAVLEDAAVDLVVLENGLHVVAQG